MAPHSTSHAGDPMTQRAVPTMGTRVTLARRDSCAR